MKSCGNQSSKCIICARPHKVKDYYCGIADVVKGKRKFAFI